MIVSPLGPSPSSSAPHTAHATKPLEIHLTDGLTSHTLPRNDRTERSCHDLAARRICMWQGKNHPLQRGFVSVMGTGTDRIKILNEKSNPPAMLGRME